MKYYLIKANNMKKTEFVGEYYFDLQKEPVELTEEELKSVENALYVFELEKKSTWRKAENFYKLKDKLRKVLE